MAFSTRQKHNCPPYSLFHLWMPDIFQFKGGIQVYSAFLLKAIQELYPEQTYHVFLKHDVKATFRTKATKQPHFHFAGKWSPALRTFVFATQLLSNGLRQRPDLIITTHIHFAPVAYWLKRVYGIPYWAIAHGIEAWDIQKPQLVNALQNADKLLAVSQYTKQRLLSEQAIDPAKVALLPNTVDIDRFQIANKPKYLLQKYHLRPEQPVILTVARLSDQERSKGYDQLLEALPQIRLHIPEVHYIIAGKGNDRPRIEQKIDTLGLRNCVSLAGFVPDEELCHYYNLCDLYAMPSTGEGFGIVYLEALACGKPTLAGNQDGAVDALCQGELGALVDPNNIKEIAEAITQILQGAYPNPLIYQPHILRERVIERFGFEQFRKTLACYLSGSASLGSDL